VQIIIVEEKIRKNYKKHVKMQFGKITDYIVDIQMLGDY
jgi:hypothetical protein